MKHADIFSLGAFEVTLMASFPEMCLQLSRDAQMGNSAIWIHKLFHFVSVSKAGS